MKKYFLMLLALIMLSSAVFSESPLSHRDILDNYYKKYTSIDDYQCRLMEWCYKGKNYEKRVINFYFKKPRNIRMDIVFGNKPFDSGSSGVFRGGDKVTGHKGGILSGVPLRVSKYDPLSTTIRGTTFDQSDLQSIAERLENHIRTNSSIKINIVNGEEFEFTCISVNPSDHEGISKDIIRLNRNTLLPSYCDRYEGDRIVQHTIWKYYIVNAGLPDELFTIKYEAETLEKHNIKTVNALPVEKEF